MRTKLNQPSVQEYSNNLLKIQTFLIGLLFLITLNTFAQTFMPAYTPSVGYKKGYVELKDGTTIKGTFTIINNTDNIKKCTIKDSTGTKHKLTVDKIEKVYVKLSKMDKWSTASEGMVSLQSLINNDFDQVFKADYYVWEHAVTEKKGKMKVLQLVNPGFDSKMKVFRDPWAQKTAEVGIGDITLAGGIEKSYYVVKPGTNTAGRVLKRSYDDQFAELFGDCPELLEAMQNSKPKWEDFPAHVFVYDQVKN